ncbi:MAG TPA: hypothetical protein VH593_01290, partial [Ktedonobacteraceae bacterium]
MLRRYRMPIIGAFLCVLVVTATFLVMQGGNTSTVQAAAPNQFKGVNWADPRDNYANDQVVPTGLSK